MPFEFSLEAPEPKAIPPQVMVKTIPDPEEPMIVEPVASPSGAQQQFLEPGQDSQLTFHPLDYLPSRVLITPSDTIPG